MKEKPPNINKNGTIKVSIFFSLTLIKINIETQADVMKLIRAVAKGVPNELFIHDEKAVKESFEGTRGKVEEHWTRLQLAS
jgi:hypothetical protein